MAGGSGQPRPVGGGAAAPRAASAWAASGSGFAKRFRSQDIPRLVGVTDAGNGEYPPLRQEEVVLGWGWKTRTDSTKSLSGALEEREGKQRGEQQGGNSLRPGLRPREEPVRQEGAPAPGALRWEAQVRAGGPAEGRGQWGRRSHALRTPLHALSGHSRGARRGTSPRGATVLISF